jgi:hypothetical protein
MAAKKNTLPKAGEVSDKTLYRLEDGTVVDTVPPGAHGVVLVAAGHQMPAEVEQ